MPAAHKSHAPHERQRQLAFALHEKGHHVASKAAVQRYLKVRPGDPSAVNLLAALHHRLGDTDSAIQLLRPLAAKAQMPAFNLAVMLLECGRTAEAEQQLLALQQHYPPDLDTLRRLALVYVRSADHARLYAVYEAIRLLAPLSEPEQANLLLCLEKVVVHDHQAQREQDMLDYFSHTELWPEDSRQLVFSHLVAKYAVAASDDTALLEAAATDAFFARVLHEIAVTDPTIENYCVRVRRNILGSTLQCGALSPPLIPVAAALVAQNQLNEYIHPCGDDESEAVAQLAQQCTNELAAAQPDVSSLAVMLLLVAMYRDPSHEAWALPFLDLDASVWPVWLQPLRDSLLQGQQREQQARAMPRIGTVDDAVSKEVQAQYEENPYPRWRRCKRLRFGSMNEYLSRILPDYHGVLPDGCRVLSAGCGTGKEPIELARSFPRCDFLAIDLSSRSLAYAQGKATELGLTNIRFAQADILQLGQWSERFDVILSSGVLHHMQDTLHAWRLLRERLNEHGVMHVALYSRLARTGINVVREAIGREQLPADLAAIRAIRARCLSGELPGFAPSRDFYSASACRDLLFHVHERQFDIPEIGAMLDQLSLRFLGFDTQHDLLPDFASHFSTPESQLDLDRWHAYELSHPQAFGMMYSLWCSPAGRALCLG